VVGKKRSNAFLIVAQNSLKLNVPVIINNAIIDNPIALHTIPFERQHALLPSREFIIRYPPIMIYRKSYDNMAKCTIKHYQYLTLAIQYPYQKTYLPHGITALVINAVLMAIAGPVKKKNCLGYLVQILLSK
jgi:hypothetical protein